MKTMIALVLAAAFGYFLGSLNFSIIVVQMMKGRDIRTMGSKNAGLTNTYRCCGPACAGLTLAGDLLKGVIAVALARWFASILSAGLSPDNDTHYIGYIAGFFAIIGHVFPIYYGFKGGKGVLVGVASFLIIDTKVFFCADTYLHRDTYLLEVRIALIGNGNGIRTAGDVPHIVDS